MSSVHIQERGTCCSFTSFKMSHKRVFVKYGEEFESLSMYKKAKGSYHQSITLLPLYQLPLLDLNQRPSD